MSTGGPERRRTRSRVDEMVTGCHGRARRCVRIVRLVKSVDRFRLVALGTVLLSSILLAVAVAPVGRAGASASSRPLVGDTPFQPVAFGDAPYFVTTNVVYNQPVVGMAATPDGHGYWMVASDGGIFTFGDAAFYGSQGGHHLNQPVVGMAATPDGRGYWMVASDGGIFTFGDAAFHGSLGGQQISSPITAILAAPDGRGYWLLPTLPPPKPLAVDWAVPGTVIYNLDSAPGSPYRPGQKVVALTFDDGPSPIYTPQVLQILIADHVPASFQIVGEYGAAHPEILRDEAANGMSLASHTWTHVDLTTLPASGWPVQVDQTDALLQGITGHQVRCLRPPYGNTNSAVVAQLGQRGLAELYWDVDPSDYLRPGTSVIVQRVLSALHPGAIVGMHDGGGDRSQTVAALPAIISGIRAAGYEIVPVCGG